MRGEYSLADIAAATGNGNGGAFGNNGDWAWIIVLFLIFGWGRNGFGGGYGNGNGGTSVYEGYVLNNDFSQLSKQISDAYSMTERKLDGVNNGLCSGFYQEAQLINGLDKSIFTTGSNLSSQLADVGYGIKDCCCQQLRAIDGVNFNNSQNTNAITTAINNGLRDVMTNCNNNYRSLHDEIVANRIEDKNAQITAQQNEINALRLAASQEKQNAYLVDKLNPNKCPIPAYLTCNPNAPLNYSINYQNGCGC